MRVQICKTIVSICLVAGPCLLAEQQNTVADVVKRSSDAVVLITISDSLGHETALGSGFLVSSDGKIVTNYHVIKEAHSAVVKLSNGAFFPVSGVIATDVKKDLAIVKVDGKGLPFLTLSSMNKIAVGEHVVAIGSPLGLEGTVSDGLISAIRDAGDRKLIQTTAPASHGNSGGPLLNMNNEVVGVIAMGISPELGQNLNFAVPCSDVTALLSTPGTTVSSLGAASDNDTNSLSSGAVWTSMTTGHDFSLRQDGDYLYADLINLPQSVKDEGGFNRLELKKEQDGKWRGKSHGRLPCTYTVGRGAFARSFTQWCSVEQNIEIDLMSPRRIEGINTSREKFDCKKCTAEGKDVQTPFSWIPK